MHQVQTAQTDLQQRIGRWLVRACFVVGLISLGYCVYDLINPGHFVGDMYGLEVIANCIWLIPAGGIMLLGMAVAESARFTEANVARLLASLSVVFAALILMDMAATVVKSRHQHAMRANYRSLSVAELLRIAREEKDQFAIDALLIKKDPAAVPGLREILLDVNEYGNLRNCAAHALGEIGTDEARSALEQARQNIQDPDLRIAIDYALQTRMGIDIAGLNNPSTQSSSR